MPAEMADANDGSPHGSASQLRRRPPDDGDAGLIGGREERVAIENQRLPGVDR